MIGGQGAQERFLIEMAEPTASERNAAARESVFDAMIGDLLSPAFANRGFAQTEAMRARLNTQGER